MFLSNLRYVCFHHRMILKRIPLKISKCFYQSVAKNVVIYSSDNKSMYVKLLSVFGFAQLFMASQMAFVSYETLPALFSWMSEDESNQKEDGTDEHNIFKVTDKERKTLPLAKRSIRLGLSIFTLTISCVTFFSIGFLSVRRIHSITLLKSGNNVLFKTYNPTGSLRDTIVPVSSVSALSELTRKTDGIRFRLKGHYGNYLVYKSGSFPNPDLFARTVGKKRDF